MPGSTGGRARPVLLAIGHCGAGFGFGRVLSGILAHLTDSFEVHQFELTRTTVSSGTASSPSWTVHPKVILGDFFGIEQLASLIPSIAPDIVLIVKDLWHVPDYVDLARKLSKAKVVAYCPIDGSLRPHFYLSRLGSLDRLVLFTEFARSAVIEGIEQTFGPGASEHCCPPIDIIPHGVDPARFFPIGAGLSPTERRREARARLLPERPDLADGFLVLNANRNQPRKAVDLTIEAFAQFARGKPANVQLYLHMGVRDEGCEIIRLADQHGISGRLLLTGRGLSHPRVDDATLNLIYNACELGVNTSFGEGWGLVAFEHAATGAAQLVPRHSACAELWRDHGVLVETTGPVETEVITGHKVSVPGVAAALEQLYSDPTLLGEKSAAAAHKAAETPSWPEVSTRFSKLFAQLLNQPKQPEITMTVV